MVTCAVLAFINSWNEYLSAIVFLPTSDNYTVSQGIQFWINMSDEYNLMMTAAASAIVPVVILFLFTQRYFVESIATTGVKG
jgi:multiple sugar transport system permease protein